MQTDGLPGSTKPVLRDFVKNMQSILPRLRPEEARAVGAALEDFGGSIVELYGERAVSASS